MDAERVGGLVGLAFGLVVMVGSYHLGFGTLQAPGSGFLGCLAGAFVTLMALIILVQTFMGQGNRTKLSALWQDTTWWRPAAVAFLILLYVLALERLGFLLTSLLCRLAVFKGVERFSWLKTIIVAVSAVAVAYLLFHTFLKTPLPRGFFDF
jgi:putative tricarboxylic transport membrane protein